MSIHQSVFYHTSKISARNNPFKQGGQTECLDSGKIEPELERLSKSRVLEIPIEQTNNLILEASKFH